MNLRDGRPVSTGARCLLMRRTSSGRRRCMCYAMKGSNVCYAHRRRELAVDRALAARQLARAT